METTGEIIGFTLDYDTGKPIVQIRLTDRSKLSALEDLRGNLLRVAIQKFRKKRSLDANALFHVLLGQLADALGVSKPYMKNMLLRRYGQIDRTEDGGVIDFILRDDLSDQIDEYEAFHLYPTSRTEVLENGKLYRVYLKLKGSHELDTREMSVLIDGTIEECKAQGIDVTISQDLEEIKRKWHLAS